MMHDAEAMLHFYTGDLTSARVAARRAEYLGRHLPYRYCFATSQCMIEALSGNLIEAVEHGRRALALQPGTARKIYPPTLRYLGASHSALGQYEQARQVFSTLQSIDPNASSAKIDIRTYPTPSGQAAAFLCDGLRAVSM